MRSFSFFPQEWWIKTCLILACTVLQNSWRWPEVGCTWIWSTSKRVRSRRTSKPAKIDFWTRCLCPETEGNVKNDNDRTTIHWCFIFNQSLFLLQSHGVWRRNAKTFPTARVELDLQTVDVRLAHTVPRICHATSGHHLWGSLRVLCRSSNISFIFLFWVPSIIFKNYCYHIILNTFYILYNCQLTNDLVPN